MNDILIDFAYIITVSDTIIIIIQRCLINFVHLLTLSYVGWIYF